LPLLIDSSPNTISNIAAIFFNSWHTFISMVSYFKGSNEMNAQLSLWQ
jgi:hypothetical protein